jgi:hypothetical protein
MPQNLDTTVERRLQMADTVIIPVDTLKKWKGMLEPYWFSGDRNNDGILLVNDELHALIAGAEGPLGIIKNEKTT